LCAVSGDDRGLAAAFRSAADAHDRVTQALRRA
jgi:hypothetical protein